MTGIRTSQGKWHEHMPNYDEVAQFITPAESLDSVRGRSIRGRRALNSMSWKSA